MRVTLSFLTVTELAALVAAVPQPGSGQHLWHRRNGTTNALLTGSGTPVATGASMQNSPSSTQGSTAGNSSAVLPAIYHANTDSSSPESNTDEVGTSAGLQAASNCGMWDATPTGDYNIQNLLWGEGMASSGSQCYGVDGLSDNTIAWHSV